MMKFFKQKLTAMCLAVAAFLAAPSAYAGSIGAISQTDGYKNTYVFSTALTTPGTATTDFCQLAFNAKIVRILDIQLVYTTSASNAATTVKVLKCSAVGSAGTTGTSTILPMDTGNPAVSSTGKVYSANPTAATPVNPVSISVVNPTTSLASPGNGNPILHLYQWQPGGQALVLRNAGECVVVNFGGVIPGGTSPLCAVNIFFTEE